MLSPQHPAQTPVRFHDYSAFICIIAHNTTKNKIWGAGDKERMWISSTFYL